MPELNKLHVKVINIDDEDIFNSEIGWLQLKKSKNVRLVITEFEQEYDEYVNAYNKQIELMYEDYNKKIKEIDKDKKANHDLFNKKEKEYRKGDIKVEEYNKHVDDLNKKIEGRAKKIKEINLIYEEKQEKLKKELEDNKVKLQKKYENTRWVSRLAGNTDIKLSSEDYCLSWGKGIYKTNYYFPEFLEGG